MSDHDEPIGPGLLHGMVDQAGIAQMLGVHRKTVSRWYEWGRLPHPDFEVGDFRLWHRPRIRAWYDAGGSRQRRTDQDDEEPGPATDLRSWDKNGHLGTSARQPLEPGESRGSG